MTFLKLSVDLEAELSKITRRQHLNDVHYLVNLIREAVSRNPTQIHVEISEQSLVVSHDGSPLDFEHRKLLLILLGRPEASDYQRQEALTHLEEAFGITLLSLFVTFSHCSIQSQNYELVNEGGVLHMKSSPDFRNGFRIEVRGSRRTHSDEHHELRYFCSGAHIPITVNGETINQALELPGQLLSLRFDGPEGYGFIGLPSKGKVCGVSYFKGGVRIGSRQYLRRDGLIYHATWNHADTSYEPNFSKTIALAEEKIKEQVPTLYSTLPQYFDRFTEVDRERLKKILFGQDSDWWQGPYRDLALFHGVKAPWSLSLGDLEGLQNRFHGIPYAISPMPRLPKGFPLLSRDEVAFLNYELGYELRRVMPQRKIWRFPSMPKIVPSKDQIVPNPQEQQLLACLQKYDPFVAFQLTPGKGFSIVAADGKRVFGLPRHHAAVVAALEKPPQDAASYFRFKAELLRITYKKAEEGKT